MESKSCVICGGEESEGELLIEAPCGRHWVCPDDVSSFFERATKNESLFPPKCCGQMFMLQEYEDYVPFDIAWDYQIKEQGEYSVLAKYRVYCAHPPCGKFLSPTAHVTDPDTNITYAICENENCNKVTCTGCRTLLDQGTQNHICKKSEDEEKFKQTVTEKGYQECSICGATVELAEACNHITCECGHDFCYICGRDWTGLHGCPQYGPATYDAEGYNEGGYHRDTGLNREGLTRRQDIARRRGEAPDDEEENDDDDDGDEDDPDWEVLQHLAPEQRVMINTLHGNAREDALDQLRITLFETQGITFGQDPPAQPDEEEQDDGEDERGEDAGADAADPEHDHDDDDSEHDDHVAGHDDGEFLIDEDALPGERYADDQSEDARSDRSIATSEAANQLLQDLGLDTVSNTGDQSVPTGGSGNADSPPTEPDDARPATPMDIDTPGEKTGERAEPVVGEGEPTLWGPPSGWPGGDDDGEL